MYQLLRNAIFTMDPEKAHEVTVEMLKLAEHTPGGTAMIRALFRFYDKRLETKLWGLTFPNPVGLAAGFDKNAEVYHALSAMGFGHIEVGTVTPLAQPGNEKPRLYRLVDHEAVINRMGFNNEGAYAMSQNLTNYRTTEALIGVNIGKNKVTPNEEAASDYLKCMETLYPYGHFFVINISSPNTPNLRDLQETESLRQLLGAIKGKARELEQRGMEAKPILLKVAPDMSDEQMHDVVHAAVEEGVSGIVATNTTIGRDGVNDHPHMGQTGGLSGKPLEAISTAWVREIYQEVGDKVPIIGVGGVSTGEDAYRKIRAGASMIQVYTSMIYRGPGIAGMVNKELLKLLVRDGFEHVQQAVGVDCR